MIDSSAPARPLRILVAEDDDEMRSCIVEALTADGHTVLAAADGAEAMGILTRAFAAHAPLPDVLVTDVRMPGYEGTQLIASIRLWRAKVQVIIVTVFGAAGLHAFARSVGAVAVLEKPFDLDELHASIRLARAWQG